MICQVCLWVLFFRGEKESSVLAQKTFRLKY